MSATIEYKIISGAFPVKVNIISGGSFPENTHNNAGTYSFTGLEYDTNYDIQFVDNRGCLKTYKNLKMITP